MWIIPVLYVNPKGLVSGMEYLDDLNFSGLEHVELLGELVLKIFNVKPNSMLKFSKNYI